MTLVSLSTYWYIHSAMLSSHSISFLFFPVHMVCIFTTSTMLTSITHNLLFVYIMYLLHMFMHFSEKAMAPHSSTLAWKISWMEEPGRLQSMRSLRVGHGWATSLSFFTFMLWRRKCQPTPVFLPGESQGWGSLVGCCLWGHAESDTTEVTAAAAYIFRKIITWNSQRKSVYFLILPFPLSSHNII